MTPLHDLLPEEREEPHATLITLLQRAYSASVAVPPDRQAQIIARVQERLLKTASETPLKETMPGQLTGVIDSSPRTVVSLTASSRRRGRLIRLSTLLAAVLVIGAIVGTSLLISLSRPQTTGAPSAGPVGTPVTIRTQAGGLEASMQITPGPYFLDEFLVADLSLTNHSQITYLLQGTPNMPGPPPDTCHPPLTVAFSGGEGSSDTMLRSALSDIASCWNGPGSEGTVQVQPGQTITVHQSIALMRSGHVTFTARGTFQKSALGQDGVIHIISAAGPLDGHWPSLSATVARQVPPARSISLQRQGLQVHVDAPPAIRSHLLYMSVFICDLGPGSTQRAGADNWIALPGETIPPPACGFSVNQGTATSGTLERWSYVAGAPGYAIASGMYPS